MAASCTQAAAVKGDDEVQDSKLQTCNSDAGEENARLLGMQIPMRMGRCDQLPSQLKHYTPPSSHAQTSPFHNSVVSPWVG